uniref:Lipocalin/cytosolic fatty-acid binding domain-containing protein n=1 Tax=Sus scrofa TaxID=9823 RepID=A0A8D0MHY6_PIG
KQGSSRQAGRGFLSLQARKLGLGDLSTRPLLEGCSAQHPAALGVSVQPHGVRAQSRSGHQQGGVLETPPGSPPPFPFCLALPCHRATTVLQARVSQSPPQAQCSGSPGAAHRVPGHHDQASPSLVALGGSTQGRPGGHISKQLRDSVIRGNAQTLEASPGDTPAVPGNPTAAQMGRGLWTRAETIVGCGLNKQKVGGNWFSAAMASNQPQLMKGAGARRILIHHIQVTPRALRFHLHQRINGVCVPTVMTANKTKKKFQYLLECSQDPRPRVSPRAPSVAVVLPQTCVGSPGFPQACGGPGHPQMSLRP